MIDHYPEGHALALEALGTASKSKRARIYEEYARLAHERNTGRVRNAVAGSLLGAGAGGLLAGVRPMAVPYAAGAGAVIGALKAPSKYEEEKMQPAAYRASLREADKRLLHPGRGPEVSVLRKSAGAAESKFFPSLGAAFYPHDTTAMDLANPHMKDELRKSIMKRGISIRSSKPDPDIHGSDVGYAGGRALLVGGEPSEKHRPALLARGLSKHISKDTSRAVVLPLAANIAGGVGGYMLARKALKSTNRLAPYAKLGVSAAAGWATGGLARRATMAVMDNLAERRADTYAAMKQSPEEVKSAIRHTKVQDLLHRRKKDRELAGPGELGQIEKAHKKRMDRHFKRPETRLGRAYSIARSAAIGEVPLWSRFESIDKVKKNA